MNTKKLMNMAIKHRQSQEICFRKRCGEGIVADISRESGVNPSTLHNWKNGKTEASFSNLRAVLNTCGLDFEIKKRVG